MLDERYNSMLYFLPGYPYWRDRQDVLSVFELPQVQPILQLYDLIHPRHVEVYPLEGDVGDRMQVMIAYQQVLALLTTAVTSRYVALAGIDHKPLVGSKFEDFLLEYPLESPTSLDDAIRIASALQLGKNEHRNYLFSYTVVWHIHLEDMFAGWFLEFTNEGTQTWARRDAKGRLRRMK